MYGKILKNFSLDNGISQKEIASRLNYSPQRVNNYFRDMAEPPFEFLKKFKSEFSVDLKNLLENEQKGLADDVASCNPIPVFDLDLKPIKGLDFFNYSELVSYYIEAPLFNDCFAAVRVSSAAMAPAFALTDILVIKKIENFDTIPYGAPFLIITDEQRLLRYIRLNEGDSKNTFLLKAANPAHDDMVIKKTDIKHLFQVNGKMCRL